MAAGWNKGKKLTEERGRKISLGRLNSPKLQAQKEETKRRRELEKQINAQISRQEIARRGWIHNSPETRKKISQAHKGCIPWNKGVEAWNRNKKWPLYTYNAKFSTSVHTLTTDYRRRGH